jgi:hypothetical protein
MRCLFTRLIAELVLWVNEQPGHQAAFDEVTERVTAKDPTSDHMKNSVHHVGLAADLLLYINGVYQESSEAHRAIGEKWKSMHPLCRWGGDFRRADGRPRPDGNHYSFEYQGRA